MQALYPASGSEMLYWWKLMFQMEFTLPVMKLLSVVMAMYKTHVVTV
jgi:hypothetical protein